MSRVLLISAFAELATLRAEIERLTSERDRAREETAMMVELAGEACEDYCSDMPDLAGHGHSVGLRDAIRAITPADATAALAARDKATRESSLKDFGQPAPAPAVPVEGAPDRIWAWEGDGQDGWDNAYATTHHVANDQVEYVRADIALRAQPAPQAKPLAIPEGLIDALRSGEQADMDGCRVKVSRQACEEAADILSTLSGEAQG